MKGEAEVLKWAVEVASNGNKKRGKRGSQWVFVLIVTSLLAASLGRG
jgi:hypothetical protein